MNRREQILAHNDLRQIEVATPEWGDSVWVRELTAAQWIQLSLNAGNDDLKLRTSLVEMCALDAEGNKIFEAGDLQALAGKNYRVIKRISDAALKLNAVDSQATERSKANFTPAR